MSCRYRWEEEATWRGGGGEAQDTGGEDKSERHLKSPAEDVSFLESLTLKFQSLVSMRGPWPSRAWAVGASFALALSTLLARLLLQRNEEHRRRRTQLAVALLKTRNKLMHDPESIRKARAFKPKPKDVFISTYPKCGTTWVMQIVHAIKSNADMNFGEITEKLPWDVLAHQCHQDLDAPQDILPRAFKSHETWATIPKGGRYIYVARDPIDAFYSFYLFLPAYLGLDSDDITPDAFADALFSGASESGQIWQHFLGWYKARHEADILWVFFEDLKEDLGREVVRIADWLDIDLDDELLREVVRVSSYNFMSAPENVHHFDDHFVRAHVMPRMFLPANLPSRVSKVRVGGGSRRSLPARLRTELEQRWSELMLPETGFASYSSFRASFRV